MHKKFLRCEAEKRLGCHYFQMYQKLHTLTLPEFHVVDPTEIKHWWSKADVY